ncbi:type 2 periplasmic-binding domain-containing protein [Cohnella rhizosphaerae]|uniref:hypothetical protein n=1 Tax=Cohnella rhizosphaerae TaxID=1457232 RepID=UPI003B8A8864
MTLDEKIAQFIQLAVPFFEGASDAGQITGPMASLGIGQDTVRSAGSVLGMAGAQETINVQREHLAHNRLGIPLLMMADIVHGFKTIFPVPLAIGCSWDLPAGPDGKIGTKWQNSGVNSSFMVNKNAAHPEAILLYYNYMLDNLANPAAGSAYEHGFAKGYDWDIVDGQPTSDSAKIKNYNDKFPFITGPARIPDLYMKTLVKLADGGKPETPFEKQQAESRKPENWYAAKVVMSQIDVRKQNYFTGAATPTMIAKWNLLRQSELETFNKIIYDKLPVDAFDTFVASWKANGGDQVTKEVNDWFRSVQQ